MSRTDEDPFDVVFRVSSLLLSSSGEGAGKRAAPVRLVLRS